jgi:hypothetical protein
VGPWCLRQWTFPFARYLRQCESGEGETLAAAGFGFPTDPLSAQGGIWYMGFQYSVVMSLYQRAGWLGDRTHAGGHDLCSGVIHQ